jgi:hypothetical protein
MATKHLTALEFKDQLREKDRQLVALSATHRKELSALKEAHAAKLTEVTAAAAWRPEALRLSAMEGALAAVTRERDLALMFDARKQGVPHAVCVAAQLGSSLDEAFHAPAEGATDAEKWTQHGAILAKSPAAAERWRKQHISRK